MHHKTYRRFTTREETSFSPHPIDQPYADWMRTKEISFPLEPLTSIFVFWTTTNRAPNGYRERFGAQSRPLFRQWMTTKETSLDADI